jgi:four helix bundle protein
MSVTLAPQKYDLEERTLRFAKDVIAFVETLPRTLANVEVCKQLVRAAGSVGANYIEANEALGKKDFLMKVRISRRESKECRYWLQLVSSDEAARTAQEQLIQESTELMKILGAILRNSEKENSKYEGNTKF